MLDLGPPLFVSCLLRIARMDKMDEWNNGLTFDLIFSKLAGEVREKQSRKTSVWGYERGRSRLYR